MQDTRTYRDFSNSNEFKAWAAQKIAAYEQRERETAKRAASNVVGHFPSGPRTSCPVG